MFGNIPAELQQLKQWVVWRLEFRPPMLKPTKVPYIARPNSGKASVTKAADWATFEEACSAPLNSKEPVDPDMPISQTGYTGIGFVFIVGGDYTGVDLDNVYGDKDAEQHQLEIYNKFNSYTEYSPSRNGVHIIVKGQVPVGRRRGAIGVELYPHSRFFTMTGDVLNNVDIREGQDALDWLYNSFGGDVKEVVVKADLVQSEDDAIIVQRGKDAVNGPKFTELWEGRWQSMYASQSEADFALMDILAFYTKHIPQLMRLFRQSMLGQRDKAQRDQYLMYMVEKSFDRTLPDIDFDVFAKTKLGEFHKLMAVNATAGEKSATVTPGKRPSEDASSTAAASTVPAVAAGGVALAMPEGRKGVNPFPPGLLGQVAQFFYDAAPRPSYDLAFVGAVAFLSGITGRAYNVSSTGLNQYILMLAQTGLGKDAIASGIAKLTAAIAPNCPSIVDFKGPGQLVSSPGLIKWIDKNPNKCVYSIIGEFGQMMKQMVMPHAPSHLVGLKKTIMELYSKSGYHEVLDPMAYSDKEKNTATIRSPSFTLFGESVPEVFYESLDETMLDSGFLPRFMVFHTAEKRQYYNKNASKVIPSLDLVTQLTDLAAYCLGVMHRTTVHNIPITPEAEAEFDKADRFTTDTINVSDAPIAQHLWNRMHLKAMKLAALQAVCENYINPTVTLDHALWANKICHDQIVKLIAKFETGQVGQLAANGESKQLADVIKVIREFLSDINIYNRYGGRDDMFANGTITESAIQRKTAALASFRHDRMGATAALKRTMKTLLDADDLREIPPAQMSLLYGTKPRAYQIANPKRFAGDLF